MLQSGTDAFSVHVWRLEFQAEAYIGCIDVNSYSSTVQDLCEAETNHELAHKTTILHQPPTAPIHYIDDLFPKEKQCPLTSFDLMALNLGHLPKENFANPHARRHAKAHGCVHGMLHLGISVRSHF